MNGDANVDSFLGPFYPTLSVQRFPGNEGGSRHLLGEASSRSASSSNLDHRRLLPDSLDDSGSSVERTSQERGWPRGRVPMMSWEDGVSRSSISPGLDTQLWRLHISGDPHPQSYQTTSQLGRDFRNFQFGGCSSSGCGCPSSLNSPPRGTLEQFMNPSRFRKPERERNSFRLEVKDSGVDKKGGEEYEALGSLDKYTSIDQVRGRMVAIAKTHAGSEFLKERCETPEDLETVFSEVRNRIFELTRDTFGSGLVRCLLKSCDSTKREEIVSNLTRQKNQLCFLACHAYGSRVVQDMIGAIKSKREISLVGEALRPRVVDLIKDGNGYHVVRRWLAKFKDEEDVDAIDFLFDAVADECVVLANHLQGYDIVKACVDCAKGEPKEQLIKAITKNALCLSQNQYGNFVLQHVLNQEVPWITEKVVGELRGHFASLSTQICSSNVVEKCMKYGGEKETTEIIMELFQSPCLLQIFSDRYGNYVAQTALECSKGYVIHSTLIDYIFENWNYLSACNYGRKVADKARKLSVLASKRLSERQISRRLSFT